MSKYIICLGDGMADEPLEVLGNKTPLQAARTPAMDLLARSGKSGLVHTVPDGLHPGSDVCNMGILGYNPHEFYTGRGPIEAAAMNINPPEGLVVFRCNLVCITNGMMKDFTAGHITTEEAHELMTSLNESLPSFFPEEQLEFFPGVSYRHILLLPQKYVDLKTTAPHDITDQQVSEFTPKGETGSELMKVFDKAAEILEGHPVNKRRIENGLDPATHIWPWSQGIMPSLPSFESKFGMTGGIVTAVDLLKGLGTLSGLITPSVDGATGFLDTNYKNKLDASFKILEKHDFVYIHIEAPDEAGHMGRHDLKIQAIEDFDKNIVMPCLEYAKSHDDVHIMVLPDHPTPCHLKTHSSDPVPVSYMGSTKGMDDSECYDEESVKKGDLLFKTPWELLASFLTT